MMMSDWQARPWRPRETWINDAVAALADVGLAEVAAAAVTGNATSPCCGAAQRLLGVASGKGEDWPAVCAHCGAPVAGAESKPRGAPGHHKPATPEDYQRALERGLVGTTHAWPGLPPLACATPHPWQEGCLQWPHIRVRRHAQRRYQLCLPQVTVDSLAHPAGNVVTLVAERTPDQVYLSRDNGWGLTLTNPHTTPRRVLGALHAAKTARLKPRQQQAVRRAASLIWARASWEEVGDDDSAYPGLLEDWLRERAGLC